MMNGPHIWPQDPWGRVLNGAALPTGLPVNVLTMAETASDLAHDRFGDDLHSVYLTGPLARNQGLEPEFIIVLRHMTRTIGLDLFSAAAAMRLQKQHSEFVACRFSVFTWEDIFPADGRFSYPRFRLGVNSVAVAGRDLKRLIAPQRLSPAAANALIVGLRHKLTALTLRLKAVSTETRVHSTSRLFARTCLDAAFALVMSEEQVYTEDPETMASFSGLSFTENRNSLAALVRLSRTGTLSSLEALAIAREAMVWLPDAADAWLDVYNPARDVALRMA